MEGLMTEGRGFRSVESLCWYCRNAVPRLNKAGQYECGCNWSLSKIPVKGWYAQMTAQTSVGLTYLVLYCPEYKNDCLPEFGCGKADTRVKRLFEINWQQYGVDIFPDEDIFGVHEERKRNRVNRKIMNKEWCDDKQRENRARWQRQYRARNREKERAKAREKYRIQKYGVDGTVRAWRNSNGAYGSYVQSPKEYQRRYGKAYRERKKLNGSK